MHDRWVSHFYFLKALEPYELCRQLANTLDAASAAQVVQQDEQHLHAGVKDSMCSAMRDTHRDQIAALTLKYKLIIFAVDNTLVNQSKRPKLLPGVESFFAALSEFRRGAEVGCWGQGGLADGHSILFTMRMWHGDPRLHVTS